MSELCYTFRDEHPENVFTSMQTIMEVLLEESEDVPENLLLSLLSVLGHDNKVMSIFLTPFLEFDTN